jgi:hypothetical protein
MEDKAFTKNKYINDIGREHFPEFEWESISEYKFYLKDNVFELIAGYKIIENSNKCLVVCFLRDTIYEYNKILYKFEIPKVTYPVFFQFLESNIRKFSNFKRISILTGVYERIAKTNWDELNEKLHRSYLETIFIKNILKTTPKSATPAIEFFDINTIDELYNNLPQKPLSEQSIEFFFEIESFVNKIKFLPETEIMVSNIRDLLIMAGQSLDIVTFEYFFNQYKLEFEVSGLIVNDNFSLYYFMDCFWNAPAYKKKTSEVISYFDISKYKIKEQITKRCKTKEEFISNLQNISYEECPKNLKFKSNPNYREEIVEMKDIYGIHEYQSWVSGQNTDEGILELSWKFNQFFQIIDLNYKYENPIKLISFIDPASNKKKYWVADDGKCMILALKSLEVDRIPVLIGDGEVV